MPHKKIIFNQPDRRPQYLKNQTQGTPVGWCRHNAHRGKLSLRQMRSHNCRGKNCQFFVKNDNHPHWIQKSKAKQAKQARRVEGIIRTLETEISKAIDNIRRFDNG